MIFGNARGLSSQSCCPHAGFRIVLARWRLANRRFSVRYPTLQFNPLMPLVPGSRLDSYEIVAPLGAGGMGKFIALATAS
jgi:hypothetical protein